MNSLRETIKELEKRVEALGHRNGELQQTIRLAEARHQHEVEQMGEEQQKALLAALDEIQRLKDESVKPAAKRSKAEAEKELHEAYSENARLVEFIQQIADASRTKFSADAKKLLGQ